MLPAGVRSRIGPAALLLLPVALIALAAWPGHMNADVLDDLEGAATGYFGDWRAPILLWAWHSLGLGPGWVLTLQTLSFMAGIYLLLRAFMRRWPAAVLANFIALVPPVFGPLLLVGRDMWFLSATLLAFGAAIRGTARHGRARLVWFSLAVVMAWCSQAARQNALPVLVVLLGFLFWVLVGDAPARYRSRFGDRAVRIAAVVVGALLASLAIFFSQTAVRAAIGVKAEHPEQALYIRDLEAISRQVHRNLFPPQIMPRRGMTPIDAHYDPDDVFPLIVNEFIDAGHFPVRGKQLGLLRHAWLKAIKDHPGQYALERISLELRQLSITRSALIVYHPGISRNWLGYKLAHPALDRIARGYLDAFATDGYITGGFPFSVWIYLLLATASGVALLRRGRGARAPLLVGLLGLSAWGLQLGLLVAAEVVTYRFEAYTVVVGLITTSVAATVLYGQRERRAKHSVPERAVAT